jgi:hydrogenase expression/formation protein HypC
MCLAIPGRLVQWIHRDAPFSSALVEFDGVSREVAMGCVPNAERGDYVIVHAGVAISKLDEEEARELLAELRSLNGLAASEGEP